MASCTTTYNTPCLGQWLLLVYLLLVALVSRNNAGLLLIEQFYSQSFVLDNLEISCQLHNNLSVDYNVTLLMHFPGKLLFSFFVRKLGSTPAEDSHTILKYKNMDFCKTAEILQNYTTDNLNTQIVLLQTTFITSCPLTSGFYYIVNGTMADELIPSYFDKGWYWMQFELLQVFDEVTKLMNVKAKIFFEGKTSVDDYLNY